MRRKVIARLTIALGVMLFCVTPFLVGDNGLKNHQFTFAVFGDQPYLPQSGNQQVYPPPEYQAMIANINTAKVDFAVHIGDIKAGATLCTNNVYTENLALFNSVASPMVYLPGDNEWTDCHRVSNGGYHALERLAFLRSTFFTSNQSLGQTTMTLERQSNTPGYEAYVENVRWNKGIVLFVGINMPGSNNNHEMNVATTGANRTAWPGDRLAAEAEYVARNAANIAWINQSFDIAQNDSTIKAVMIFAQANPFERFLEPLQDYTTSGYADFVRTLRYRTIALNKPVAYVNGDTHTWRLDKPLYETYPCNVASAGAACTPTATLPITGKIENFIRHEVFAQNDSHWTLVRVEPQNPNIFVFEQQIVPENVKFHASVLP